MSTAGQAAGGVLGAVAGFFIGGGPQGALYGAQIGMMVGGYIDPPKGPKQEPPATKDLTVQTATYGASRPRLYGTITVYANIFWLENNLLSVVVKKTKQSGGKGGKKKTTVVTKSYYGTFAAGLCDCPSAPIVGVKRIWLGGKLWYDAGSTDQDTIRASNEAATNFTLHLGSDTQLADDRMQATLGIANTPAYRGLAYIVFKDLPLAPYGDTLMGLQIKVEVMTSATIATNVLSQSSHGVNVTFKACIWFKNEFYMFAQNINQTYYYTSPTADSGTWVTRQAPAAMGSSQYTTEAAKTSKYIYLTMNYEGGVWRTKDGRTWVKPTIDARSCYWGIASYGEVIVVMPREYFGDGKISTNGGETWIPTPAMNPYGSIPNSGIGVNSTHCVICGYSNGPYIHIFKVSETYYLRMNNPTGYGAGVAAHGFSYAHWFPDINKWVFGHQDGILLLLSADFTTWEAGTYPPIGQCNFQYADGRMFTLSSGTNYFTYDCVTWTAITPLYTGATYCFGWNDAIGIWGGGYNHIKLNLQSITTNNVTLASIVSSEVLQSKVLAAGDIDVTLLASQTVRGYKVSNVAAIRSALEPLQGAWPFDVVHHGYKIQFKPRGTTSVVTIPEASLDARSGGDAPGTALTSTREMDSVLPRRVTMQYLDYSREYDVNTQYAERLNTDAVNIQSLDLAIVLTSDEAARIVEVLLYMYWLERYSLKFSLPSTYNNLEPGDVVTITASTGTYVLRLTQITYTADGRLECDAKYSRSATYTSTAVGGTPPAVTVTLALPGDSAIELLDIPLLDDTMNQAGYVAAMTGYSSGWTAGEIYRTDDGGATWLDLQAFASPGSSIGYASNAIGAGRTDIFDNYNVLQAYFLHDAAFSSVTELAVLNGSNYFAYGVHGRWEIIAAKTCSLQSDGSYLLSDLLRGRKGTEWACGLHAAGDTVVALDNSSVIFIGSSSSLIGLARTYRGVTDGQTIDAASDYAFTYTGVNLECYAPVYLNGSRSLSTNDWTLNWIPRTRVGGEWRDYVDATMIEASESYAIEIYLDGTYTTLKRTLTATTPTVQYTSANQVTDFGANQATVYYMVKQVSAVVGTGYPLTASVYQSFGDPFWANVVLAMHMDGAEGGTTFTDLKGKTITANGGVVTKTGIKKAGSASAYFNGTTDYLSTPDSADFAFGAGDFTVECWVYLLASPSPAFAFMGQRTTDTTGLSWTLFTDNAPSVGLAYSYNGTSNNFINTGAGALTLNQWYHLAVCRSGTNLRMFLDGVLKTTQSIGTNAFFDSPAGLKIGACNDTPNYFMNGYIDDPEITKAAKYTSSFTPVAPFLEA